MHLIQFHWLLRKMQVWVRLILWLDYEQNTRKETNSMETIDKMAELRATQKKGTKWTGVDVRNTTVTDMYKQDVLEPLVVKEQIIKSATEAASMLLRIDDVIAAGKSKMPPGPPGGGGGGMGGMGGGYGGGMDME